jgi:hypothetical protein
VRTIQSDDIRIPKSARDAIANHDHVVVLNRERPAFVILNPDDYSRSKEVPSRGRPLTEALALLRGAPLPDDNFAKDLEAVRAAVGLAASDPWEPS